MSIQMSIVFGVLVTQMAVVAFLLLPLPHSFRVQIVKAWVSLRQSTNYKVGVMFSFVLMLLQFIDSLQKISKFSRVPNPYYAQHAGGALSSDQLASKFYAQRNLYISGAVLFLSMSINTILSILSKLTAKENLYRAAVSDEDCSKEVSDLKEAIKKREVEIVAMKKQISGIQKAYDSLNESPVRSKDD